MISSEIAAAPFLWAAQWFRALENLRRLSQPEEVQRGVMLDEALILTAQRIWEAYPDGPRGSVILPVAVAETIFAQALADRDGSAR